MKTKKAKRYGFTLVELIFAIMVIAIAVISMPMMSQITAKGLESNIVQEAIFAASTELMGASSGYWDKNSMADNNASALSRVIDLDNDCDNNASSSRYRLRVGHISQHYHRRCLEDKTIGAADASDTTYINLDNAEHAYQDLFTDTVTDSSGYKYTYQSKVDVNRNDNNKTISVKVKIKGKSDSEYLVELKMMSANIGEIDYYKRRF
jgi:prepilin-type N-terminal cleavage/methylation domain-containing protein